MKILKTKHFRRIVVFLAMLAPVVYLFGTQFAALYGAHGEEILGNSRYYEGYVLDKYNTNVGYAPVLSTSSFGEYTPSVSSIAVYFHTDGDFNLHFDSSVAVNNGEVIILWYDDNGDYVNRSVSRAIQGTSYLYSQSYTNVAIQLYSGVVSRPVLDAFPDFQLTFSGAAFGSTVVSSSYSDSLFGNFFAKDNFLEKIGKDVLSDTPHGFSPFASFWKYLDENMLHMGDMQLGLMGYGYVYYCCHVLLFDIAFILVTFFLDFIQKVNDKVVGGVD